MTSAMILRECHRRGIALDLVGEKLLIKAKAGGMTDSLRAMIRAHKPEIIASLRGSSQSIVSDKRQSDAPTEGEKDNEKTEKIDRVFSHPQTNTLGISGVSGPADWINGESKTEKTNSDTVNRTLTENVIRTHPASVNTISHEAGEKIPISVTSPSSPPENVFSVLRGQEDTGIEAVEGKTTDENHVLGFVLHHGAVVFSDNSGRNSAYPIDPWAAFSIQSPPRPMPWRAILSTWPIDARERWGRRADALQDAGHDWYDAERLAFEEVNGEPIRLAQSRTADEHAAREEVRFKAIAKWWDAGEPTSFTPAEAREAGQVEEWRNTKAKEIKGRVFP